MSRTQRKYDHEYKVQAVKLAREIGGAKAAKELGIKVIRIDCNYKTDDKYEYILNNILNSDLKNIVDLSKIDFDLSNKNSINSLIVKTGELWNQGLTAGQIRKELNIGEGTITSYLKTASKIGVCDYSVENQEQDQNIKKCIVLLLIKNMTL